MTNRLTQLQGRNYLLIAYSILKEGETEEILEALTVLSMLYATAVMGLGGFTPVGSNHGREMNRLLGQVYVEGIEAHGMGRSVDLSMVGARLNRVGQLLGIDFWAEYHYATSASHTTHVH